MQIGESYRNCGTKFISHNNPVAIYCFDQGLKYLPNSPKLYLNRWLAYDSLIKEDANTDYAQQAYYDLSKWKELASDDEYQRITSNIPVERFLADLEMLNKPTVESVDEKIIYFIKAGEDHLSNDKLDNALLCFKKALKIFRKHITGFVKQFDCMDSGEEKLYATQKLKSQSITGEQQNRLLILTVLNYDLAWWGLASAKHLIGKDAHSTEFIIPLAYVHYFGSQCVGILEIAQSWLLPTYDMGLLPIHKLNFNEFHEQVQDAIALQRQLGIMLIVYEKAIGVLQNPEFPEFQEIDIETIIKEEKEREERERKEKEKGRERKEKEEQRKAEVQRLRHEKSESFFAQAQTEEARQRKKWFGKDFNAAVNLYEKAAGLGHPEAQRKANELKKK